MIRVAKPDAAVCARLSACLAEAYAEAGLPSWNAAGIVSLVAAPGGVALTDDPQAPGAAALGRRAADEGEILALAVRPALRRHGIGRRLLAGLEAALAADGPATLYLEVAEDAIAARALYAAAAWTVVGRRPRYYPASAGRGVRDALVLSKIL